MSSNDLEAATDELEDLPPFEDPEPEEAADETVESEAEEATEASEGTEESPDGVESGPDLSQFPEETRDAITKYAQSIGDERVGTLESGYTQKLQQAAELQKGFDEFNRALEEHPELVLQQVQKFVEESGKKAPEAPPEPGPMPEPEEGYIDAAKFAEWQAKSVAHERWQRQQEIAALKAETDQQLKPLLTANQQAVAVQAERAIQEQLSVDDDTFGEVKTLAAEVRGDAQKAWALVNEVVLLRKAAAGKETASQAKAREQIRGSEERPGLPGTGTRKPAPRPTGDDTLDLANELEAEGVEFPEGH